MYHMLRELALSVRGALSFVHVVETFSQLGGELAYRTTLAACLLSKVKVLYSFSRRSQLLLSNPVNVVYKFGEAKHTEASSW